MPSLRPRAVLLLSLAFASVFAVGMWLLLSQAEPPLPQSPASGFRFATRQACDQAAFPDQLIKFSRTRDFVRAEITAVMNCSYSPTDPQVLFTPNKVTLAIEESPSVSGYAAACLCGKPLIFDLYSPITAGTLVILQQDGREAAQGRAP